MIGTKSSAPLGYGQVRGSDLHVRPGAVIFFSKGSAEKVTVEIQTFGDVRCLDRNVIEIQIMKGLGRKGLLNSKSRSSHYGEERAAGEKIRAALRHFHFPHQNSIH